MKAKTIRADWLERDGRRLDCNPYMTGAMEASEALQALKARKEPLHSLTRGHNGGIYNGPQFRRNFVESREHGVPFLTSGNMLDADLSTLPLLRKRDADSAKLAYLRLARGTTLISCSGTIGRMVFVRPDMDGVWSSQDVLKVVPNESRIPPGYVYAFLSSKFGVPLVAGGTYGAIIQHIEPEHVAKLRFLLTGKVNGNDPEAIGASLYEIGLVPDFDLLVQPERAPARAFRNRQCVERITWSSRSERGRALDLGLAKPEFREKLGEFLANSGVEDPRLWTRAIVFDRSNWALAFNKWEFEDGGASPESVFIGDVIREQ